MHAATKQQFADLLAQHDRELLRAQAPRAEATMETERFDREFDEVRKHVIEPVMQEVHEMLHEHGMQSAIHVEHRHAESDGTHCPTRISFEFQVLTDAEVRGFPLTTPTLTFSAEPEIGKVVVTENSVLPFIGGHVGVVEQCQLHGINASLVERHLLELARKVLRGTGVS